MRRAHSAWPPAPPTCYHSLPARAARPRSPLETQAIAHAVQRLIPEHLHEVKTRRQAEVDETLATVRDRLMKGINYWSTRAIKLQEEVQAGKQPRMQPENARRILTGFNQPNRYILALLEVGEHEAAEPVYVRNAFDTEPGWGVNSSRRPGELARRHADTEQGHLR